MGRNRVQWSDDGQPDEVFTDGGAMFERLDKKRWFLSCIRADGSEFCMWIKGSVTLTEEREPPKFRRD